MRALTFESMVEISERMVLVSRLPIVRAVHVEMKKRMFLMATMLTARYLEVDLLTMMKGEVGRTKW